MAILTRPPTAFFLAATGLVFVCQWNWRGLIGLTFGSAVVLGAYCTFNYHYFGDPWRGGYGRDNWEMPTPFWIGVSGLLIAPSRGLLVYSPALHLLPWGVRSLFGASAQLQANPRPLLLGWLGASAAMLLLFAKWHDWPGGWCYGPRFLCETMPLCCLLFGYAYAALSARWLRSLAVVLVAVSVTIHAIGVFGHAAETDWCIRHAKADQGRCLFELRDTQIQTYSMAVWESLGQRFRLHSD